MAGEKAGDCGMRSFLNAVGVRAELGGRTKGEGGTMEAEVVLCGSYVHERQLLPALEGWVLGVDLGEPLSEKLGLRLEAGVETAGDRALRKSV